MLKQVNMQTKNKTMKVKRTLFNSRNERLYWNYTDTNNYLFIILFESGATMSFILRDLKKDKNILNYIYKKLHNRFSNILEIETSRLSYTEYNLCKQYKVPSIQKIC